MFTAKCNQCGKRYWFKEAENRAKQCAKDNILAGPIGTLTSEITYNQEKLRDLAQRRILEKDPLMIGQLQLIMSTHEENIKELENKLVEVRKLGE
jgi:hypothetical protein